jgi:hypothetical protein
VSGQWRSDNGWNSHLGVFQQDLEDMDLMGPGSDTVDSSHYEAASRNDALADALGIRKTPRKAVEEMAPRARVVGTVRSSRRPAKATATNLSLLSPMSARPINSETHMMDVDTSVESAVRAPLLTLGPFSSLHPKVAMTCLYEETKISQEAEDIFLASNLEGSGILSVCLVCPGQEATNPNELRLFSFESTTVDNASANRSTEASGALVEGIGNIFVVTPAVSIPCVAAQPVEASPIAPCFHPHPRNRKDNWRGSATDILVLRNDSADQTGLSLWRSSMHVVDCALPEVADSRESTTEAKAVYDIGNSVGNRVDIICWSDAKEEICIRGSVSLRMASSFSSEKVVQALESALFSTALLKSSSEKTEIALKLRSDCVRLEQAIARDPKEGQLLSDDVGTTAVRTVVSAIFVLELFGRDVNYEERYQKAAPKVETSDWERLLQSEYHRWYSIECPDFLFLDSNDTPGQTETSMDPSSTPTSDTLSQIHSFAVEGFKSFDGRLSCSLFDALHALYEDFKLHGSSRDVGMHSVASMLSRICRMISPTPNELEGAPDLFLEHYRRDLGDEWFRQLESYDKDTQTLKGLNKDAIISAHESPPSILSHIEDMVSGRATASGYKSLDPSSINAACIRTRSLLRIFALLYGGAENTMYDEKLQRDRDHDVVRVLIEEGFTDLAFLRDELPTGVALPLLEVLHRCRGDHDIEGLSSKEAQMWSLVGREDLCKNVQLADQRSLATKQASKGLHTSSLDFNREQNLKLEDKDMDGICPLEMTSSLLFPNDNRIREVGRLLRSSRPVYLHAERAIEVSDHDHERLKQDKLLLLSRRVLALPLGRGMLTIGNLRPVPAEPLPLPDICLVGRVPPANAMLTLDTAECPTDLKVWPDFHNGVAAGLRLPLERDAAEIISKITRTWIVYNRPARTTESQPQNNPASSPNSSQNLGHSHGGLLMALGLRGHLTTLEMTDIFDYLTHGTVTTTVGVLLGMAAK